ncbi:MAG: alpha/beta fold hydrolase [Ignavibacteriaceae bacterium]|nr:alpha/beta fold hydrolase [Ignavibacteriaceae bacterium]
MNSVAKVFIAVIFLLSSLFAQSELKFAELGNFKLASGEIIYHCRIGYRTFGTLKDDKSNVILFPTWFGGKSEHLANLIGPDKLINSDEYFVIAVDALGNGISSSPSNCEFQSNRNFPEISIKDMVNSQYKLLTEHLGINHLHGIIGGSMGGMQVFEWIVSYPEFMKKAVAYVGSPKLTSYDLMLWQTELNAVEQGWSCGQSDTVIMKTDASIQNVMARTPSYVIEKIKPEDVQQSLAGAYGAYAKFFNSYNWACQLKAMMNHDITKNFNGLLEEAAKAVKTDLFIIVSKTDMLVNPYSALEFAKFVDAKTHIFDNNCGHLAPGCEMETFKELVSVFFGD